MNCRKKIISHAVAATFCLLIGQSEIASAAGTNITAAGAGSWTCPAGVTSVQVEAWGGGGGGGGAQKIGVNSYGGGGGGGAYARLNNFSVTPGSNYVFSVGAAGTAGASSGGAPF